jgi:hypothetical protein
MQVHQLVIEQLLGYNVLRELILVDTWLAFLALPFCSGLLLTATV